MRFLSLFRAECRGHVRDCLDSGALPPSCWSVGRGKNRMKRASLIPVLLALAACSQERQESPDARITPPAEEEPAQKSANSIPPASSAEVPAGAYTLDKEHASLIFRVNHLGFSNYTARFKRFDAKLDFDPRNLAASSVTAIVIADSLETDYPDPAKLDFNALLKGPEWLDVAAFPEISRPAVSRHLRVLREANLVIADESGRERHYRLNVAAFARVQRDWFARFAPLWERSLEQLKATVEGEARQKKAL